MIDLNRLQSLAIGTLLVILAGGLSWTAPYVLTNPISRVILAALFLFLLAASLLSLGIVVLSDGLRADPDGEHGPTDMPIRFDQGGQR